MPEDSTNLLGATNLAEEISTAVSDTSVLLEYLGRLPDGRLQAQFVEADAKTNFSKLPFKAPCESYSEFLNELCALWLEYKNNKGISAAPIESLKISKLAFLFWSRDFLAALAGPATADSVQFTNNYVSWRFVSGKDNLEKARSEDTHGVLPLVISVKRLFRRAIIVLIIAVLLSVYALSGQKILSARDSQIKSLKSIDEKIELIESHSQSVLVNPALRAYVGQRMDQGAAPPEGNSPEIGASPQSPTQTQKDTVRDTLAESKKDVAPPGGGLFFLCDNVGVTNKGVTPSFGPIPTGSYYYYGSTEQIEICKQRRRTLVQLFAVGEELVSWQRIATNPIQILFPLSVRISQPVRVESPASGGSPTIAASTAGGGEASKIVDQRSDFEALQPIGGALWSVEQFLAEFVSAPADVFGKSDAVPREFANNDNICNSFVGPGQQCWIRLSEISEYYGTIPENILSCITLYVLPCLYGFLGAVVAILKYLRLQVDNHWLSFTDRGRIIQTQILGVVMGSIVGLFAAYITSSNQSFGTLSVPAIAFLAGYNLSSLLTLFDDVSARLFQKIPVVSK
jgi:hypothetical protein